MTFRLANLDGTAALVDDSNGLHPLGIDPKSALADLERLHAVSAALDPSGAVTSLASPATLGSPSEAAWA